MGTRQNSRQRRMQSYVAASSPTGCFRLRRNPWDRVVFGNGNALASLSSSEVPKSMGPGETHHLLRSGGIPWRNLPLVSGIVPIFGSGKIHGTRHGTALLQAPLKTIAQRKIGRQRWRRCSRWFLPLSSLPSDLLVCILRLLDGPSLIAISCASSHLHALSSDPTLWHRLRRTMWPSSDHQRVSHIVSVAFPSASSPLPLHQTHRLNRPANDCLGGRWKMQRKRDAAEKAMKASRKTQAEDGRRRLRRANDRPYQRSMGRCACRRRWDAVCARDGGGRN